MVVVDQIAAYIPTGKYKDCDRTNDERLSVNPAMVVAIFNAAASSSDEKSWLSRKCMLC